MSTLFEQISENVSEVYHKRLKEIAMVLNPKINYVVKYTKSQTTLKENLWATNKDRSGFLHLNSFVTPLSGFYSDFPNLKLSGDFIVIHVRCRMMNPQNGKTKYDDFLHIYEKGRDASALLRRA